MDLQALRRTLNIYKQKLLSAQERVAIESAALAEAKQFQATVLAGQILVQHIAQEAQKFAHDQIASVVTRSLQVVFDDRYEFKIEFEKKRGKTDARLCFFKDGEEISPMKGSGGGLLDVASFALRLACVLLIQPRVRRLLVLDEPFRHLDRPRGAAVRELLTELVNELNLQIIMVTHSQELAFGKVIEL